MRGKYGDTLMTADTMSHFRTLVEYGPQIIFQGGEPLCAGKEWYERFFEIMNPVRTGIGYDMQSNGSLIDEEWIDLFLRNNVRLGLSYDYCSQETQRSEDILDKMNLLRRAGVRFGCISVITKGNIHRLKEIFIASSQQPNSNSANFNLLFQTRATSENGLNMLQVEDIAGGFRTFFDFFLYHYAGGHSERTTESFLSFLFGRSFKLCTYMDCRRGWLGISPDGALYPCDRNFGDKYFFGNLHSFTTMEEISRTPNFKRYYAAVQRRYRTACMDCGLFPVCGGGCNGIHFAATGDVAYVDESVCMGFRALLFAAYDKMRRFDLSCKTCNLDIRSSIKSKGGFTLNEIYSFLQSVGYMYPLQYEPSVNAFLDSVEYKVFRLFNPFVSRTENQMSSGDSDAERKNKIAAVYARFSKEIDSVLAVNKRWCEVTGQ
jgi:uncharacterized protein